MKRKHKTYWKKDEKCMQKKCTRRQSFFSFAKCARCGSRTGIDWKRLQLKIHRKFNIATVVCTRAACEISLAFILVDLLCKQGLAAVGMLSSAQISSYFLCSKITECRKTQTQTIDEKPNHIFAQSLILCDNKFRNRREKKLKAFSERIGATAPDSRVPFD